MFKFKYMMATKAYHQLGDISRDEEDLCVVKDEDEDYYIGNWVEGFGFIDVKFPKETTRELTQEEVEKYHNMELTINSNYIGKLNINDNV